MWEIRRETETETEKGMGHTAYYVVTLMMGLAGMGLLRMATDAPVVRPVYTLLLLVLNYFALLTVLFLAYTITGFQLHPCCGTGWLDWPNVVGGITVFYLPMLLGGVAQVLGGREQ